MRDKERIAQEILEPRAEDGASLNLSWEMAVQVASRLVELGYTHQPEPPADRVEAVAKVVGDILHDRDVDRGWDYDTTVALMNKQDKISRAILKLFPKPKLTKISDEEIYRVASTRYTIIAANEAAQAQLEHDQQTIRGGMVEEDKELEERGVITDGFGSSWSVVCPTCKEKSMYVVRPGKVQCSNCD